MRSTLGTMLLLTNLSVTGVAFSEDAVLEIKTEATYFEGNEERTLDLAELNQKLIKKKLAVIPETVVVGKNPKPLWLELKQKLEAAKKFAKKDYHFNVMNDGSGEGYIHEWTLCYRGDLTKVPAIIDAMVGNFLRDDQGILALSFGKKRVVRDEAFRSKKALEETYGEDNVDEVALWNKHRATDLRGLVMTNLGPQGDGTELYATFVPPCK